MPKSKSEREIQETETSKDAYLVQDCDQNQGTVQMVDKARVPRGKRVQCRRCAHRWFTRKPSPVRCPKCLSPYWNVDYILTRDKSPLVMLEDGSFKVQEVPRKQLVENFLRRHSMSIDELKLLIEEIQNLAKGDNHDSE